MPVQLSSKLAPENAEARIEIIPLIDIMFFLLASFMLVSLSMVSLSSVKVNLPTATTAGPDSKKDIANITVDRAGLAYLNTDTVAISDTHLANSLATLHRANPALRVIISGDKDARHGDVIRVLDIVRSVGIDKVAFEIHEPEQGATP